jgi:lipooligosaccharide transport system ATP-binding protein
VAVGAEAAIVGRDLHKSYDGRVAVDGVDFEVPAGTCFGFLGPNGAGKTTTMKMIYGLATVDGGELRVLGLDVASRRREVKAQLGVVPQETNLDGEFSVLDNLLVQASYFGIDRELATERARRLLDFTELGERADEKIESLSGGMKRRLLVARALINEPQIVVLDEPTTGLDPQARLAVWRAMEDLKERGVTLLLTTHYMEEAARLCDRLVIMDLGKIVAEGEPAALMREHGAATLEDVFLDLTGRHLREG